MEESQKTLYHKLYHACYENKRKEVAECLKLGAVPNSSQFHAAIKNNNWKMMRLLLSAGRLSEETYYFVSGLMSSCVDILPAGTEENRRFVRLYKLLAIHRPNIVSAIFNRFVVMKNYNRAIALLPIVMTPEKCATYVFPYDIPDFATDKFSPDNLGLRFLHYFKRSDLNRCKQLLQQGAILNDDVLFEISHVLEAHWNFALFELVMCPKLTMLLIKAVCSRKFKFIRHICKFFGKHVSEVEIATCYRFAADLDSYDIIELMIGYGVYNAKALNSEISQLQYTGSNPDALIMLQGLRRRK